MALNATTLQQRITDKLRDAGFDTEHPDCVVAALARAVAEATVETLTQHAEVNIPNGSSQGTYQVK